MNKHIVKLFFYYIKSNDMFKLFKKKTPIDKLYDQYETLLGEAHKLSTINRTASDEKQAEANAILDKIDVLKNQG